MLRVLVVALMISSLGLLLSPAIVGLLAHAKVDALGWANYTLLALKLGAASFGVIYFFVRRDKLEDAN